MKQLSLLNFISSLAETVENSNGLSIEEAKALFWEMRSKSISTLKSPRFKVNASDSSSEGAPDLFLKRDLTEDTPYYPTGESNVTFISDEDEDSDGFYLSGSQELNFS